MPTPVVIDLSHHNTIPQSLQPAMDAGILGIIHKCTEGLTFTDDKLKARWSLARDVGMLFGVYHFIRPGSPIDQAGFFVDTALSAQIDAGDADGWVWALDYEDPAVSLDDVATFLAVLADDRVMSADIRSPVLYSGHVLKEKLASDAETPDLSRYRLWLAQYASSPTLPPGWDRYWLWQYSDQGEVPGIDPPSDVNAYAGSVSELVSGWARGEERPSPELIEITITVASSVPVKVIVKQSDSG